MKNVGRNSKKRDAVLEQLRSTYTHPTAERLYRDLKDKVPGIGLATVYRNLKLFQKQGIIQKIDVGDGLDHFDAQTHLHYHFCCTECGSITDLDMPMLDINEKLPDGLVAKTHQLTFFGVCNACKKEQSS